jgi:hypothetical protein
LEVAQALFLRPLLDVTRLDHQRNPDVRERLALRSIGLLDVNKTGNLFRKVRNKSPSTTGIPLPTTGKTR